MGRNRPEGNTNKTLLFLILTCACFLSAVVISHFYVKNNSKAVTPGIDSWESRYLTYENGWFIDERIFRENGLLEEEEVEIIYGPFVHLNKGSYYALIDYETSFNQSIRIYAFENEDKIITDEETELFEDGRQVCYKFDVTDDIDNFEVRVVYSGEGSLLIKNIGVYGRRWGMIYHLKNLLTVLGILFLTLTIVAARPGIYGVNPGRELWLDMARGIGIVLVLLGHCPGNPFAWLIYGFHMPLFFILSGYLFKNEKINVFVPKLIRRYIIPYLVFCFANSILRIPYMMVGNYTMSGIKNTLIAYWIASLKGSWRQMPNCMPLWFLPALAVALLVFRVIKMIPFTPVRIVLYTACALIGFKWNDLASFANIPVELPWGQHTICTDVAFIAIGYSLKLIYTKYKDKYDLISGKRKLIYTGLLMAGGLSCIIADHLFFSDVDIYFNSYGNIILTYAGAVSMSLSLVMLCMWFNDRVAPDNVLIVIGFNSVFFFAFDFWGKILAQNFPRIVNGDWWLMTFILKFIFISLLFVLWKNIRACIPSRKGSR